MATTLYNPGSPTVARLVNQHEQLYAVDSHRGESRSYLVNLRANTCSCPHFVARLAGTGELCKHLNSVREQVEASLPARTTGTAAVQPPIHSSVKTWGPRTDQEAFDALTSY